LSNFTLPQDQMPVRRGAEYETLLNLLDARINLLDGFRNPG
jgi:hypothetical protein